jgi:hypothetical protein
MATNDPEFYQSPKFTPEPPVALPRQRGCFFYGCIIASVLALLVAILLGIGIYIVYVFLNQGIKEYTATEPRALPKSEMPAEQVQTLKDRVEAFRNAVKEGTPAEPLELTSDDLNALIEADPDLKGKIFVKIEGKEIKGQVSLPLDAFAKVPLLGMLKGRYLNGEATFKASLDDGFLLIRLDSIEVNGKSPPDEMMNGLRQQNLAKDFFKDPKAAELLRKIESLEVKDSKIILKVRAKRDASPGGPAAKAEPSIKDVPKAEPAKTETPKAKVQPAPAESPAPKS